MRQVCVDTFETWERIKSRGAWSPWTLIKTHAPSLVWPDYHRHEGGLADYYGFNDQATSARNLQLLREEKYDGRPVWVISYEFTVGGFEGPGTISHVDWVDKYTYFISKSEIRKEIPYGPYSTTAEAYSDYNDDFDIDCGA
jgi:hypothetical protein